MRSILAGLSAFLFLSASASAQTPPTRLLSFEPPLQTSQWWSTGALQQRINEALAACDQTLRLAVDHKLGRRTADAIALLRTCAGFQIAGEDRRRDLTVELWRRLFPSSAPLDAGDRIHILLLTFESTDYDQFLWNVGQPSDPTAWGTWGPFGATFARGAEIRRIVDVIETRAPGLVERAFNAASGALDDFGPRPSWRTAYCSARSREPPMLSGYALLRSLSRPLSAVDKAALSHEFCDDVKYRVWYRAFRSLGHEPVVRAAYDEIYHAQNRRIVASFSQMYAQRGLPRTETDWAFFLDRSTQFTTNMALAAAELDKLPSMASPAQRRLAISRAHRPKRECPERPNGLCVGWSTRVGRDMSYIVDALGEGVMGNQERAAWRNYGSRRVSALGLDDVIGLGQPPY